MGTARWFPIGGERRGVRPSGVAALAAALICAVGLGSGCGPGPEASLAEQPVVTAPEEWFDARAAAQRQGTDNLALFYAPTVVLDHRVLGPAPIRGEDAALAHFHERWSRTTLVRVRQDAPFLGVDAAATIERIDRRMSTLQRQAMIVTRMGPEGATRETLALSVMTLRTVNPDDVRVRTVHDLADRYARAWSAGTAEVRGLYAAGAVLVDSMLGLDVREAGIADLKDTAVSRGGLRDLAILQLPDLAGPAIYGAGRPRQSTPMDVAGLVLTTLGGTDCPQQVAVVLTLDEQYRITREERFHRADDLGRCAGDLVLPGGWWDGLEIPETVRTVLTGTLTLGGVEVAVYNGTPDLEGLLEWGFERYADAGLAAPRLTSVTYHNRLADICGAKTGLTLGTDVILCFEGACDDCITWERQKWVRATLLHELAHVWMAEHLTDAQIERFTQAADLPTWASAKEPWGQRGTELAAETFAWALLGESYRINNRLDTRSCAELASLYEILTGAPPDPLPPCPYAQPDGAG